MNASEFTFRRVSADDEMRAALRVRHMVFCDEQHVPEDLEYDEFDESAVHYLIVHDKRGVIGTARLLEYHPAGTCKVGRFAILPEFRGMGLGAGLMRFIEDEARSQGYRLIVLDAQLQVRVFYEGLGYVAEGGIFLDAGIEHIRMTKVLSDE